MTPTYHGCDAGGQGPDGRGVGGHQGACGGHHGGQFLSGSGLTHGVYLRFGHTYICTHKCTQRAPEEEVEEQMEAELVDDIIETAAHQRARVRSVRGAPIGRLFVLNEFCWLFVETNTYAGV